MTECCECAADGGRDIRMGHGEPPDVNFENDLTVPAEGGAIGERGGRWGTHDGLRHQGGGVLGARRTAIEQQLVQAERPVDAGGPGVHQQL